MGAPGQSDALAFAVAPRAGLDPRRVCLTGGGREWRHLCLGPHGTPPPQGRVPEPTWLSVGHTAPPHPPRFLISSPIEQAAARRVCVGLPPDLHSTYKACMPTKKGTPAGLFARGPERRPVTVPPAAPPAAPGDPLALPVSTGPRGSLSSEETPRSLAQGRAGMEGGGVGRMRGESVTKGQL